MTSQRLGLGVMLGLFAAAAVAAPAASPAASEPDAFAQVSSYAEVDLSVPSSPAFAVLGVTPDSVQRPGTIRDFVGSIAHGLGTDGKPLNGVAIDISPVSVFFRDRIRGGTSYASRSGDDFENWPLHVAARTTVSFGTTSADANGATRSAFGLRMGLLDYGDPGLYSKTVSDCVKGLDHPAIPSGHGLESQPFDMSSCALSLWAKPALYAGYGQSWYSQSGSLTDHAPDVRQFWLSYSQGLTGQSMPGTARKPEKDVDSTVRVLGQLYFGRRMNDRAPDPNDSTTLLSQRSSQAIARLRGGKANWHAFVELGRSWVKLGNDTNENLHHTAIGAEFNLGTALGSPFGGDSWLQIASVNERGFSDGKDHSGITVNFKIGASALPLPGPASK